MEALTRQQLIDIREALVARIREGLASPDQEVKALPAYLKPPQPGLAGKALVVDAGGTNMRAALVELTGSGFKILAGPFTGLLPDGRDRPIDSQEFFRVQADLVRKLQAPTGLPLGYCFSYPAEVLPHGDARLLAWTKGIKVSGVEGEMVGSALAGAIGDVPSFKVLNDTVAALMGGAALAAGDAQHFIGLIVGTGTNMASFFEASHVPKLAAHGRTAINLESGNFHPPHLSSWDDEVDQASNNPGQQRMEKAVSGYYLPYVFERLCPGLAGFDAREGSGQLSDIIQHSSDQKAKAAATWIVHRSADIVAAGLAGVAEFFPPGTVGVQAEGGLFWKTPGYPERVKATLADLLGSERKFVINHTEDVNLVGAASAALVQVS